MDKRHELELFDALSRIPRLKEWLTREYESSVSVLVQVLDNDQLRRAQGRAQAHRDMLELLDKAPTALRRGQP